LSQSIHLPTTFIQFIHSNTIVQTLQLIFGLLQHKVDGRSFCSSDLEHGHHDGQKISAVPARAMMKATALSIDAFSPGVIGGLNVPCLHGQRDAVAPRVHFVKRRLIITHGVNAASKRLQSKQSFTATDCCYCLGAAKEICLLSI
jgi:hypothetical protein